MCRKIITVIYVIIIITIEESKLRNLNSNLEGVSCDGNLLIGHRQYRLLCRRCRALCVDGEGWRVDSDYVGRERQFRLSTAHVEALLREQQKRRILKGKEEEKMKLKQ